jgi:hypothetical protein
MMSLSPGTGDPRDPDDPDDTMADPGVGLPWGVPHLGERRVAEPAPGLGGQPRRTRSSAPAHAKASSAQAGNWVTWPGWARVAVPVLICLLVVSAVGAFASRPRPVDDAVAPRAPTTEPASSGATVTGEDALPGEGTSGPTTTSTRPTTTTTAATATGAPADEVSAPTATTAPRPTSTGPPATGPPATDSPPTSSGNGGVRPGGPCSPEGATALSSSGAPMVCSAVKCDGSPNDQPRWRRATC